MRTGYVNFHPGGITVGDTHITDVHYVMDVGGDISGRIFIGEDVPLVQQLVTFWVRGTKGTRYVTLRSATTDIDGGFLIDNVTVGNYSLKTTLEQGAGSPNPRKYTKTINNVPVPSDDVVVQLGGYGSIAGWVIDADSNESINDFEVTAGTGDGWRNTCGGSFRGLGSEFEEGFFLLDKLTPGRYILQVHAKGYGNKTVSNIVVKEGEETEEIEVLLGKDHEITGRVISKDMEIPIPKVEIKLRAKSGGNRSGEITAATNAEGAFTLSSVSSGKYRLQISHPDFASKSIDKINVKEESLIDLGDIILSTGAVIEGRVIDSSSGGAAAYIYISQPGEHKNARTDKDGYYKISGIAPGKVNVHCNVYSSETKTSSSLTKSLKVKDGQSVTVDFEFPEGIDVYGQITNNGESIGQADISLSYIGKSKVLEEKTKWRTSCRSDENSYFSIAGVPPGEYRIGIYKRDNMYGRSHQMLYQHDQKITIDEQNYEITISTWYPYVAGMLIDTTGNPVANRAIQFRPIKEDGAMKSSPRGRRVLHVNSKKDGAFSLGYVMPGYYQVMVVDSTPKKTFQPVIKIIFQEGVDVDNLQLTAP